MPNVKIHIEEALLVPCQSALVADLQGLREVLCRELSVGHAACQLAILPVLGLDGQPPVNVELFILPKPDRTREKLLALAGMIRARLEPITGASVAVRIAQLDAATYVALK
jgi:hypothetical protein